MHDIIITPELCFQFLIWSYYYHSIMPSHKGAFISSGMFTPSDAERIEEIFSLILKFYDEDSIRQACKRLDTAKETESPCPYTQELLDMIFAKPIRQQT